MTAHARLSPSGAHRWMPCPGSVVLEAGCPNTSSVFADEGTAAHFLASECLTLDLRARAYLDEVIVVYEGECGFASQNHTIPKGASTFKVDGEMADSVDKYINAIREYAEGNELLVEQRVEFSSYVDVEGQFGTADAVIVNGDELQVHDLKYGKGVAVDADENPQLMLYALGALNEFGLLGDFERVLLVIHQPRLGVLSEWGCSVETLLEFAALAKFSAGRTIAAQGVSPGVLAIEYLNPGDKQCRFCKAKATCPALARAVSDAVFNDFDIISDSPGKPPKPLVPNTNLRLANAMVKLDMIESWCKAVRSAVEISLLAGVPVPGFKLVQGKRGNRQWCDDDEAEKLLKSMRLKADEMYSYKIISPTQAEKLLGDSPRKWPKVEVLITQADGRPSVAPESDPRPAFVVCSTDDFENVATEELEESLV